MHWGSSINHGHGNMEGRFYLTAQCILRDIKFNKERYNVKKKVFFPVISKQIEQEDRSTFQIVENCINFLS